jgi:WD40 repeat protein
MKNPFIGPHPIPKNAPIFGRNREITELRHLLIAERIVLLYSPSGAGKSSLVNAGLIPEFANMFDVWEPTRVNTPSQNSDTNPYVQSAIAGWKRPGEQTNLKDFVTANKSTKNPLLIFDQFEEILRTNPTDTAGQKEFFRQLADLLALPHVWALIIIREDFLAPLLPYFATLPTHLRHRYRLNLFTPAQAESCMRGLASQGEPQRTFQPGALAELTASLSTAIIQSLDGKKEVITGSNVEPMQMQVVCHRLWNGMDADDTSIDLVDVQKHADVVASLGAYYNDAIIEITGKLQTPERAIRDWFSRKLITREETRGQVQKGEVETEGLPTAIVEAFVGKYIVRVEERRTTRWYELSHDSLVRPILKANSDWRATNLTHAQKAADTWAENGKPDGLLLTGDDLTAAQSWHGVYTPVEQEFLERSARRQAIEDAQKAAAIRESEQNQKLRKSLRIVLAVSVVALLLAGAAWASYNQAKANEATAKNNAEKATVQSFLARISAGFAKLSEESAKSSEAKAEEQRRLALESQKEAEEQERQAKVALHASSMLEASRALYLGQNNAALVHFARALRLDPTSTPARTGIAEALQRPSWGLLRHRIPVPDVLLHANFSSDGKKVIVANGNQAQIWNVLDGKPLGKPLPHKVHAFVVSFSADGRLVLTTDGDRVLLWNATTGEPFGEPLVHTGRDPVLAASFSHDSTRVLTAAGHTARIWNVAGSKQIGNGMSHGANLHLAVFSPKSDLVLTASLDKDAQVWNAASGAPIGKPLRHAEIFFFAQFNQQASRVVTGSKDRAQVWNALTADPIGKPIPHPDTVYQAELSSDNRYLVTASADKSARLWSVNEADPAEFGTPIGTPLPHTAEIGAVHFMEAGRRFITVAHDAVQLWDTATCNASNKPIPLGEGANILALSADRKRLLFASSSPGNVKHLNIWDLAAGGTQGQILSHETPVRSAVFSPDSRRIVTAAGDNAHIWNATTAKREAKPLEHHQTVTSAVFSPDSSSVLTASHDHFAQVWNAATGNPAGARPDLNRFLHRATFSPDGRFYATVDSDYIGQIFITATGKPFGRPLRPQPARESTYGARDDLSGVEFSPDGKYIVTASAETTAQVWNVATQSPVGRPLVHKGALNAAHFSPDGQQVLTASADKTAQIWNAQTGQPIGKPFTHSGPVDSAAFSNNGQLVVTASADLSAQVWDVATGDRVGRPMLHTGPVQSAAFSPEGRRVITASFDKSAQLWDAATGAQIGTPLVHGSLVAGAVFSPDGRRIVTASADQTARLYEIFIDSGSPQDIQLLAELADAIGGATINEIGAVIPIPDEPARLRAIRAKALRLPDTPGTLPHFIRRLLPE